MDADDGRDEGYRVEVAVTRYCASPMAAIDALAAALNFDLGLAQPEPPAAAIEDLTDRLVDAIRSFRLHGLERTRAVLNGGQALTEIRSALPHGDFGPYCETHGLGLRTAQRWMQLAESGLSAEDVQARGGIRKALKSLALSQAKGQVENAQNDAQEAQSVVVASAADLEATDKPEKGEDTGKSDTRVAFPLDSRESRNDGMRRCAQCKNTARRGAALCRPCEDEIESGGSTRIGSLIRENRKLRKSIAGLKWQLANRP